ncbi:hypothetical protein STEG23_037960 [Scotinomys teguina]
MNLQSFFLLQRTPRKQKRKKEYEGDHHSAPSHSENPSVQIEDEIIDALSVSDCMSLMEAIEKDVQKAVSEIFEKYKHYICMKKEQPHSLRRRQRTPLEQKRKKEYEGDRHSAPSHSENPSVQIEDEIIDAQCSDYMSLMEAIEKDRTPLEQKRKKEYEGDRHSAPSHSENPSVQIEDEIIDAQCSDYMSLMEAIEKDVQKAASEILEKYKCYYICTKKEQPHSLRRRQRTPLEQKRKKEYEGDCHSAPSHSENPSVQIEDEIIDAQCSDYMSLMEAIEKDVQKAASEIVEKYKCYYICTKKEQPHSLRRRQRTPLEQKQKKEYEGDRHSAPSHSENPSVQIEDEIIDAQCSDYMSLMEAIEKDRTPLEQKRKKEYEGDHHSAPSHSENPSVQIEDEIIDAQCSDYMSLMEAIEKDVQKAASEILEKYKCYYICTKKEQPHSLEEDSNLSSEGQSTCLRTPLEQKRKKEYEGDRHSAPSHSENPSVQIEDEIIDAQCSDYMSLMEAIEKDVQKAASAILEKYKCYYICTKKEQPHSLRRRQDKEMKPWKTYGTPISLFEHRIAALHVQPALAVYLDNFDDEGDMKQVAKAEWAHPVDLASSIEHQRWH